jgi:hypothetical protein
MEFRKKVCDEFSRNYCGYFLDRLFDLVGYQDVEDWRWMMGQKHLFTDGTDTVIAENEQDADAVWRSHTNDDHDTDGAGAWVMISDDKPVTIWMEFDNTAPLEGQNSYPPTAIVEEFEHYYFTHKVTALAGEWVIYGESFLCSTEI